MINSALSVDLLKKIGVYFYIPDGPFDGHYYHYAAECLMAGLRRLEVPVYSNLSIPDVGTHPLGDMADHVYVFYLTERATSGPLISAIGEFAAPYKMVLSMADSTNSLLTPPLVPSLLAHESDHWVVAGRREPWAFGLSDARIRAAEAQARPFAERQGKVLCNFTASHNQTVRNVAELAVVPQLGRIGLEVDRQTSDLDTHFQRLGTYVGCMAYGGMLVEDPLRMNADLQPWLHRLRTVAVKMSVGVAIVRWDSWRWWESLAAGCLTFQLDFARYGFRLPVMPEPWVHYVPIDLADVKGTIDRLGVSRAEWAAIAENGRHWALAHYSPKPTAERFATLLLKYFGTGGVAEKTATADAPTPAA